MPKYLRNILTVIGALAVIGVFIWLGVWVSGWCIWSHVGDRLGVYPSPTRFVQRFREDSKSAVEEYCLSSTSQARALWKNDLGRIPKDAAIRGHEYVITVWPTEDATQKVHLYIVKFTKDKKKEYVVIGIHSAKQNKFVHGFTYLLDKDFKKRVDELMASE